MSLFGAAHHRLAAIPHSSLQQDASLAEYTRFAIGGPASLFFDTADESSFVEALRIVPSLDLPYVVIGGGTNLVIADAGFRGLVLRYFGSRIDHENLTLTAAAGGTLQRVVDSSIAAGLKGLETMTGIPGYLGGAVYGNAGAYGRSIQELVERVRIFNGVDVVEMDNEACQFRYRDSVFKQHKEWIILSATLTFSAGDTGELAHTASEIRTIRDAKYPPEMKCAGSIFKNVLALDLPDGVIDGIPPKAIREGKVPSAWFLDQAGVRGMRRGDIQVADYHANLIYNDGAGTAADLIEIIRTLKDRVRERFGFGLEEEVQYIGFNGSSPA